MNSRLCPAVIIMAFWLMCPIQTEGAQTEATPQPFDDEVAFKVGALPVSNYLLDKFYGRFVTAHRAREHRLPSPEERASWLELFMAKVLVAGHAISLGYQDRPEVSQLVARMEQHMLTQPGGPYYNQLYAAAPISAERSGALFTNPSSRSTGYIIRFLNENVAEARLGTHFLSQPADVQTRLVLAAAAGDRVEFFNGALEWPFPPFLELEDFLGRLTTSGRWIEHRAGPRGIYYIFLREVGTSFVNTPMPSRPEFERYVDAMHPKIVERRHRLDVIGAADPQIDDETAVRLISLWENLPASASELPPTEPTLGAASLCTYRSGQEIRTLLVEDFRRHFNDRLVRRLPRTRRFLEEAVEDEVVAASDLAAARISRLDREPQFVEDRRGFAFFQALDLYEKEVLVPDVKVGAQEIEAYYRSHTKEFSRVTAVRGRLLDFSSIENAVTWIRQPDPKLVRSDRSVEVSREQPLAGLEPWHESILEGPSGQKFGPVPRDKGAILFVKESASANETLPFGQVADQIRRDLKRQKLDERLLAEARQLASRYAFEDHLSYAKYGLSRAAVNLPWPQ